MTESQVLTKEEVLVALKDVYHPEIPVNVVDLGLVERLRLHPEEAMEVQAVEDAASLAHLQVMQEVMVILLALHLHKVTMVAIVSVMKILVGALPVVVE